MSKKNGYSSLVSLIFLSGILFADITAWAVRPDKKTLPIGLTAIEAAMPQNILENTARFRTNKPPEVAGIHALGEWEEASSVMTLWPNPSYIKALGENGKVQLLADTESDKSWWQNWLKAQKISDSPFSYIVVPTNSIWIRDYGPWPIIDGNGTFAFIDNVYNRPRPDDDKVPDVLSKVLGIPEYKTGLVHTGGNFYSDGMSNAFSSTLVFTENSGLSKTEVLQRMNDFLGIENYVTSPLSPGITIEHLDTFGKLVAPDTWVFSEFPSSSQHYGSSEKMVALLKTLTSPYGTPYKIYRLKMMPISGNSGSNYRAYLNSFISNGALFFPTYGDAKDEIAKETYQKALPGYKIVGVDNGNTEWGDSIHCRSRNLLNKNTTFLFPHIKSESLKAQKMIPVMVETYAVEGAQIERANIVWSVNGVSQPDVAMHSLSLHEYAAVLPGQAEGAHISLYIHTVDSSGNEKSAPIRAPGMTIDLDIK